MRRRLGSAFDRVPCSSPFLYAVRKDSLLNVEQVRQHFDDCQCILKNFGETRETDYFGRDLIRPIKEVPRADWDATFDPETVAAIFATDEVAIDPEAVGALAQDRLTATPEIGLRFEATVLDVETTEKGGTVVFEVAGNECRESYDHVVNALWSGRLKLDARLGLRPRRGWLWRLRRNLRVTASGAGADLPSVTTVFGPYGDTVNFRTGSFYFSWYPVGRVGLCKALAPPNEWANGIDHQAKSKFTDGIVAGLSAQLPAVRALARHPQTTFRVTSGIVFAWGETDIDDRDSALHKRNDIGVETRGRYHTVNTGKFTTAPLIATEVAARIAASD
jgi:hypothetical protein